jgi:hypothetical protein
MIRVKRGTIKAPPRILVYGPPGTGKTTFACSHPSAVLLESEHGSNNINVDRLSSLTDSDSTVPKDWTDALAMTRQLSEPSAYRCLAIDSLDGLEALCAAHVCKEASVDSIDKAFGGWGKGQSRVLDHFRELLAALERVSARGLTIVATCHASIRTFKNPEGTDYDRYIPSVAPKIFDQLYAWFDSMLFTEYETGVVVDDKANKGKMRVSGKRILRTERGPGYEAKNRYGLPVSIVIPEFNGWQEVQKHLDAPAQHRATIQALLPEVKDSGKRQAMADWLSKAPDDSTMLGDAVERIKAAIAAQGSQSTGCSPVTATQEVQE